MSDLRSLPRLFIPEADPSEPIHLPQEEVDKLRRVLRLGAKSPIAVLPNDGTLIRCSFEGHFAVPVSVERPDTEPKLKLTVAQSLPKGDKLDEIVRACTEIGVSKFVFFHSERTVVRWEEEKLQARIRRLATIAREACEVSFRTVLPTFESASGLEDVLARFPDAVVLSEAEGLLRQLPRDVHEITIVVGPEGGWARREMTVIGDRGVTLGPRVLRVDHAAPAAAAMLLLG